MSRPAARCLAALALIAMPAWADPQPDGPVMAAVGWLGWGAAPDPRHASCTGVLVAPDLVLTADHCLTSGPDHRPADAARLTFRPGLGDPDRRYAARGAAVILPATPAAMGFGLAWLRLAAPVPADVAVPLPLFAGPPPDRGLATVGYPRSAPGQPVVQTGCSLTVASGPIFGLDCKAVSGFSGGPVLVQTDAGWRLAGIMVANARKSQGVGAIALSPDVAPDVGEE